MMVNMTAPVILLDNQTDKGIVTLISMGEAFVYLIYFWLVINFVNTVGKFKGCKVTVSRGFVWV